MELSKIHSIEINKAAEIYLLSYGEFDVQNYLKYLTDSERLKLEKLPHPTRKREFVAPRILRTEILGKVDVSYSDVGAPYIGEDKFISISHTTNIVGIALSEYRVGFDLEPIRDKAKKLCTKFLHDDEMNALHTTDDLEMTTAWSMKESLYKLAGRKEIIFKDDLRLKKTDSEWIGTIYNPNETIHARMKTFHSGNNVLTINFAPVEIEQLHI